MVQHVVSGASRGAQRSLACLSRLWINNSTSMKSKIWKWGYLWVKSSQKSEHESDSSQRSLNCLLYTIGFLLTALLSLNLPRGSRWTAGRRWRSLHCQRIQPRSGRCSQERWQWSRLPAVLPPGSTAPSWAERWRWRSGRWTPGPGTRRRPVCGQWCAAGWAHNGSGLLWPLGLGTPRRKRVEIYSEYHKSLFPFHSMC